MTCIKKGTTTVQQCISLDQNEKSIFTNVEHISSESPPTLHFPNPKMPGTFFSLPRNTKSKQIKPKPKSKHFGDPVLVPSNSKPKQRPLQSWVSVGWMLPPRGSIRNGWVSDQNQVSSRREHHYLACFGRTVCVNSEIEYTIKILLPEKSGST